MRNELIDLMTAYLMGWKTARDCAEWFASIDWDDSSLDPQITNVVGRMELLTTEFLEGLRPEAELWQEAAILVARETDSLYSEFTPERDLTIVTLASSSNDSPNRPLEVIVSEGGAEVSQSWSISPQLVPG